MTSGTYTCRLPERPAVAGEVDKHEEELDAGAGQGRPSSRESDERQCAGAGLDGGDTGVGPGLAGQRDGDGRAGGGKDRFGQERRQPRVYPGATSRAAETTLRCVGPDAARRTRGP